MKKRKIITFLLVMLMVLPMNVSAITKDQASNWYYGNVSNWARPELVSAVTRGIANDQSLFRDCSRNITRKEFATLVVNLYESVRGKTLSVASISSFTDTTDVNVRKAYNYGIINGVGNKKFAPNDSVTREQMAVMIYNSVELIHAGTDYNFDKGDGVITVSDKTEVSSWATNQVDYMFDTRISTGDGTNFYPKRNASVEQAVAIVNRVYDKYNPYFDAEAKVKAKEEARAKAEAEEKARAEAKAKKRKIKKFTVDDIINCNYGFCNEVKKFPYGDGYVLHIDGAEDPYNEGKIVLDKNMDRKNNWYTDVDIETYLSLDKKHWYSDVGIMLRVNAMTGEDNKHNGYYAGIRDDGDVVFGVHSVRSGWKELKKFDTNVNPQKMNKLRVKAVGSSFTIYLNDRELGTVYDSTYSAGKVGLRTWDGYVYYYGITVKDLD